MKKFFSFVCAAAVALSASAFTPVQPKVNMEKTTNHKTFEKPALDKDIQISKAVRPAFVANTNKAHRAAAATLDYTVPAPSSVYAFAYDTYYGDGSWTLSMADASNNLIAQFELVGPSTGNSIAGTYTTVYDETNYVYCYATVVRAAGDTLYSSQDGEAFTISYVSQAAGADYPTYHISGNLTAEDQNGNAETLVLDFDFTVTVAYDYIYYYYCYYYSQYCDYIYADLLDAPVIVTGDTIECPSSLMALVTYHSDYTLQVVDMFAVSENNVDVEAYFIVEADSLAEGAYTLNESVYFTNCVVVVDTVQWALNSAMTSTVEFGKSINGDTTYIDAYLAARDGNVYHFNQKYFVISQTGDAWTPQYQYSESTGFTAGVVTDDTYLESNGYFYLSAYHETNNGQQYTSVVYVGLMIEVDDATLIGSYTIDNLYSTYSYAYDLLQGLQLSFLDANFSITDTDMDNVGDHLEGDFACLDGFIHHITIDFTYSPATGLQNNAADVKVEKIIKNGQLIIRKGDKEYNVLGAQF